MRFSTTNTVSMTHSNATSTLKRVFSSIVSKLPRQQASVNAIKIHPMPAPKHNSNSSAISKQDDIHRNLRNYYTATQNSRKRHCQEPAALNEKDMAEREMRHKTVKQYQQTKDKKQSYQHWKEYSSPSSSHIIVNKSAPPKYKTHGYVRDTRSNPNHLRIAAMTNSCSNSKVMLKEKHFLPKRKDEFQWGSKSKLANAL